MVFKQNFIAVVKFDGRILRERKHTSDSEPCVVLPFGSEYTLLMKNQESRDCVVRITIDGEDVLDGSELIIRANNEMELEGFLDNSKNKATHRFKFIQKTEKIIEHRGDKIDDGIIRIEYQFVKEPPKINTIITKTEHHHHHHDHYPYCRPYWVYTPTISHGANTGNVTRGLGNSSCESNHVFCCSTSQIGESQNANLNVDMGHLDINQDEGITVKGSKANQSFRNSYVGPLENTIHSMVIRLVGMTSSGTKVEKPIEVKTKLECDTCGTKNKSSSKFCSECGTALI